MSIKLKKALRTISKVVLVLVGIGLLGYLGYLTYMSVTYRPIKVKISNITDSSFTVSWVTESPMRGVVYYKENDNFLPGPLAWIGSSKAVDDRDFARAQMDCVYDFNKGVEVEENFMVSGSDFDCEDISVDYKDYYFTHHVTLKNLDSEKDYYFRVSDGFLSWEIDGFSSAKTFSHLEEVKEPEPVFGKIVMEQETAFNDSIIYAKFSSITDSQDSILYSSVTNDEGGWYLDSSSVRGEEGNFLSLLPGEDILSVRAQFLGVDYDYFLEWVYGSFDGAYPDIDIWDFESDEVEQEPGELSSFGRFRERLVGRAFALLNDGTGASTYMSGTSSSVARAQATIQAGFRNANPTQPPKTSAPTPIVKSPQTTPPVISPPTNYHVTLPPPPPRSSSVTTSTTTQPQTTWVSDVQTQAQEHIDKTKEDERLCSACSGFVTEEQVRAILSNPESASQYVNTIGAGNVTRIFLSAGIPVDKQIMEGMIGLNFNAGNLNMLDTTSSLPMTQAQLNSMLDAGEDNQYYALTQGGLDWVDKPEPPSEDPVVEESASTIEEVEEGEILEEPLETFYSSLFDDKDSECEWIRTKGGMEVCIDTSKFQEDEIDEFKPERYSSVFNNPPNFNIPVEIEGGALKIRNLNEPAPGLVYNQSTGGWEINDFRGFVNYTFGAMAQTHSFLGNQGSEFFETLQDFEIPVPRVSFQSPLLIDIEGEETDLGTTTVITPGLQSPVGIETEGWNPISIIADSYQVKIADRLNLAEQVGESISNLFVMNACIIDAYTNKPVKGEDCIGEGIRYNIFPGEGNANGPGSFLNKLSTPTYAQQENDDDFVFYFSERGLVDITVNGEKIGTNVEKFENDVYIFYEERNGMPGFQPPEDIYNPREDEDRIITRSSIQVEVEEVAEMLEVPLKPGINIVSFDSILLSNGGNVLTANGLIQRNHIDIRFIADFSGGRWSRVVRSDGKESNGQDFPLIPGKGYLIFSRYDTTLEIPSYPLKDSVPLFLSSSWNLVGLHGYNKAYTARSFIDSVNQIEGLTADNVSWWPTSKGRYEGLQVVDGQSYGFDFPMSPMNGYFVRISEFEPTQEECTSVIWREGASSHGTCVSD